MGSDFLKLVCSKSVAHRGSNLRGTYVCGMFHLTISSAMGAATQLYVRAVAISEINQSTYSLYDQTVDVQCMSLTI